MCVCSCIFRLSSDRAKAQKLRRRQNEFKPDVIEWGQRGILECAKILDQLKAPLPDDVEEMARGEDLPAEEQEKPISTAGGEHPEDSVSLHSEPLDGDAPLAKKRKEMTLEEYEAMLEAEDGPGGFIEGGDIAGARHQHA